MRVVELAIIINYEVFAGRIQKSEKNTPLPFLECIDLSFKSYKKCGFFVLSLLILYKK